MGKEFWLERWNQGAIGWHQTEAEPALIKWASKRKPTRILVPLCGKSLDMIWLRDQGYEVVGVELSPTACETFFNENKISFEKAVHGEHVFFKGGGILLINGDFFTLTSEKVGNLGAVYDRAALIALPTKLRTIYAQKIIELLGDSIRLPDFEILEIVLERSTKDQEGPPYSVSTSEVVSLYGKSFEVRELQRYTVDARGPVGSQTEECILLLKAKN